MFLHLVLRNSDSAAKPMVWEIYLYGNESDTTQVKTTGNRNLNNSSDTDFDSLFFRNCDSSSKASVYANENK